MPQVLPSAELDALFLRLRDAVSRPWAHDGHSIVVTMSLGAACAPRDAASARELMQASDTALYTAKAAGRNSLRSFTAEMLALAQDRLGLLNDLRAALEDGGQLRVHYQPQIDLASGPLCGFEALVRWLHPQRGMVSPAEFIPLAEDSGLIVALGAWVLSQACHDAARCPARACAWR